MAPHRTLEDARRGYDRSAARLAEIMVRFHCHPIGPDIGPETPDFANVFGISYPTPIPEFTTRFARGTEIRRRGSRESEIGINLVCSTLTSLIANLRFARTAYLGRKRRGDSLYIRKLLSSSLHTYGGNLSVIPSQESPQIHAISPPSLRVSVVRSLLLYGTLVISGSAALRDGDRWIRPISRI